jgi:hypothetical protein
MSGGIAGEAGALPAANKPARMIGQKAIFIDKFCVALRNSARGFRQTIEQMALYRGGAAGW